MNEPRHINKKDFALVGAHLVERFTFKHRETGDEIVVERVLKSLGEKQYRFDSAKQKT